MKKRTLDRIITVFSAIIFIILFVAMLWLSCILVNLGVACESEMPSMQEEYKEGEILNENNQIEYL